MSGPPGRERGTALDPPPSGGNQVAKPRTSSILELGDAWRGPGRATAPKTFGGWGRMVPKGAGLRQSRGGGEAEAVQTDVLMAGGCMVRVPRPVLQKQPSLKRSYRRGRSRSFRARRNPD